MQQHIPTFVVMPFTIEDLWSVYRSVHPYPTTLAAISAEAGRRLSRTYDTLAYLEGEGLINEVLPLHWILTDA